MNLIYVTVQIMSSMHALAYVILSVILYAFYKSNGGKSTFFLIFWCSRGYYMMCKRLASSSATLLKLSAY